MSEGGDDTDGVSQHSNFWRMHMRRGLFGIGYAAIVIAASGCDLASATAEGEASQPIFSVDFVDASGAVTVRIKQCGFTSAAQHNTTTCAVDSDFVLIGGGAEIAGEGNPGALLTASFPDSSLTTWTAASKDQVAAFAHQLCAYSVGLKLAGVSAATLRSFMVVVSLRSNPAEHPSTAVTIPPGFNLIGGGARANWITQGQLLISSRPSGSQWVAASKDHLAAETGTVDAFGIGITTGTITGFGSIDIAIGQVSTSISTGYGTANLGVPAGSVLASIGGNATFGSAGRMLTDLIPFVDGPADTTPGATVRSKDHESADSGTTTAFVVSIRKH